MKVFFGLVLLTIFYSASLWAAISPDSLSYTGASNYDKTVTTRHLIYGGVAGNPAGCTISPCDTCTDISPAGPSSCNKDQILPSGTLSISFTSSTVSGYAIITDEINKSTILNRTPVYFAKGSTATINILWSELCANMGAPDSTASECVNDYKKNFIVGVSSDASPNFTSTTAGTFDTFNVTVIVQATMPYTVGSGTTTGVDSFTLGPGDEKVYLDDIGTQGYFPNAPQQVNYTKVRFYFAKADASCYGSGGTGNCCASANLVRNNSSYVESAIEVSTGIEGAKLSASSFSDSSLSNDSVYVFKAAVVDPAGNIGLFTPDGDGTESGGGCVEAKHVVMPSEVMGVLANTQNCFIATAAYGSRLEPEVETFRTFRDQILLKTWLGQKFVLFYYKWSPEFATKIASNEKLKSLARASLWPVLGFASLSLKAGIANASLATVTIILFPLLLIQIIRTRKKREKTYDV